MSNIKGKINVPPTPKIEIPMPNLPKMEFKGGVPRMENPPPPPPPRERK
jgi:hypothetical protein